MSGSGATPVGAANMADVARAAGSVDRDRVPGPARRPRREPADPRPDPTHRPRAVLRHLSGGQRALPRADRPGRDRHAAPRRVVLQRDDREHGAGAPGRRAGHARLPGRGRDGAHPLPARAAGPPQGGRAHPHRTADGAGRGGAARPAGRARRGRRRHGARLPACHGRRPRGGSGRHAAPGGPRPPPDRDDPHQRHRRHQLVLRRAPRAGLARDARGGRARGARPAPRHRVVRRRGRCPGDGAGCWRWPSHPPPCSPTPTSWPSPRSPTPAQSAYASPRTSRCSGSTATRSASCSASPPSTRTSRARAGSRPSSPYGWCPARARSPTCTSRPGSSTAGLRLPSSVADSGPCRRRYLAGAPRGPR